MAEPLEAVGEVRREIAKLRSARPHLAGDLAGNPSLGEIRYGKGVFTERTRGVVARAVAA